jgi:hypothetical protein
MNPNGDAPDSTPAATSPADWKSAGGLTRTDIRRHLAVEYIPLHAELAACLPRNLDEAHLEHHLLRLQYDH